MSIEKIEANSPEAQSADIVADNLAQLKALFPELVTEGTNGSAINVDVLKALIGDQTVTDADEKYGLNWHGKKKARQIALTPSTGTLRPCPEESVDWETTQNLMVEGDNLEVLKLLQKSYAGKVKLIYIDPPYNTGKDFVYPDNFQDNIKNYLELTGQIEGGAKISSNTEASGRFHTDWLSMIYPRLKLARSVMRDDGLILVSIDDAEFSNLRTILDDLFGPENFLASFVRRRRMASGMRDSAVSPDHEYILAFAKNIERVRLYGFPRQASDFPFADETSKYRSTDLTVGMTKDMRPNQYYALVNPDTQSEYLPPQERVWRFEPSTMAEHVKNNNIIWPDDNPNGRMLRPRFKTRYYPGEEVTNPISTWINVKESASDSSDGAESLTAGLNQEATKEVRELLGGQLLEYPKPTSLIKGLIAISTRKDDLILDFFAGSGTTGHATWLANCTDGGSRKFILVQLPEPADYDEYSSIAEITKQRLRKAGQAVKNNPNSAEIDTGFRVFKLDTSNIRAWNPAVNDLKTSLFDHLEHIEAGRSSDDILYEILLKLGLNLCIPIEKREIAGKQVNSVGAGVLMACLVESIKLVEVEALALGMVAWREEQGTVGDTTAVFRDSAFENDVAKSNLAAILEQHGIKQVRSL